LNLGLDLEPLAPGMIGRALEMMSGVANFSLSLIPLDWQCYALDTNYGINGHDLLNVFLQERILRMVATGVFAIIQLGLVCTSWSRLANPPYRSAGELNGISDLPQHKKDWVKQQNVLHDFSLKVCQVSKAAKVRILQRECKVQCMLENGDRTMLWEHPNTQRVCNEEDGSFHVVDQCQFGVPWQKATRIWATRLIPGIEHRCKCGRKHKAVIKGAMRVKLLGVKRPRWLARSVISAAYPPRLCDLWAASVDSLFR